MKKLTLLLLISSILSSFHAYAGTPPDHDDGGEEEVARAN
jgi:hypothetical protein